MHTSNNPEALLRLESVKARVGISRSQIYAMIADGRFPKPIRVRGTRVSVWNSGAIDHWIAAQIGETA